jgi:hypothetical protein
MFPTRQFRNDTKTFWFRFQNDIGTLFVLSFLTLLDLRRPKGEAQRPRAFALPGADVGHGREASLLLILELL